MSISYSGSVPDAYERHLVPLLFQPYAVDLATRVAARSPGRVLELAAGTGAVTRELVKGDAAVVATDISEDMIEIGRTNAPGAEWRTADAGALPFGDGEFDLVACQFGAMFFPDRPAAFAEARRVGGRLLFSVWGTVPQNTFAAAVMDGLTRALGPDVPPFLAVPYGYNDLDLVESEVRSAGFDDVTIETLAFEGRSTSAADVAAGYIKGTPISAWLDQRGNLDAVLATVTSVLEEQLGTGEVRGTNTAHLVEAT